MIYEKILETAKKYIGTKEKAGNLGFDNMHFEDNMHACGWKTGYAWCSFFAELVWREAYSAFDTTVANTIGLIFSGSAVQTFHNFNKNKQEGFVIKIETFPKPGSLVVWQKYKNGKATQWGHIGIVDIAASDSFKTIEGNTNNAGYREGDGVYQKTRKYNFEKTNGLRLLGFIEPKELLSVSDS